LLCQLSYAPTQLTIYHKALRYSLAAHRLRPLLFLKTPKCAIIEISA
jgi:hypothetical protein